MTDHVFVIAEAGINHQGDLETAKRMAQVAKDAGADAVKYQLWTKPLGGPPETAALLERCELTEEEWRLLSDHCSAIGIEFMVSVFDPRAVRFAVSLCVQRLKIPSGEITNVPLLQSAAATGLPVILSTGASTDNEIAVAWAALERVRSAPVTALHCVSAYPTPPDECNLLGGRDALSEFNAWGWSDHTPPGHTTAAVAAVALGARVVERHFRDFYELKRLDDGSIIDCLRPPREVVPDHAVSDDPSQLRAYIAAVREAEAVLGDMVVREPLECEQAVREGARRDPETGRRPG